jgi:protein-L-isoaspartate(D-aspartate) O-methyltransferase
MDYSPLLNRMIEEQLIGRGIKDIHVITAMKKVPRHEFVREVDRYHAYDDYPLAIDGNQTISQPYMAGYMTQELEVKPGMKAMEIGTGSGYQAAILAEMGLEVYSVERITKLYKEAKARLEKLKIQNVHLKSGDGTEGWSGNAPYDRIILTGAVPLVPAVMEEQLNKKDGIIVAPVGGGIVQQIVKIRYRDGVRTYEEKIGCVFVPLLGKYGF